MKEIAGIDFYDKDKQDVVLIEIEIDGSFNSAYRSVNKEDAIQIINYLKEQFEL